MPTVHYPFNLTCACCLMQHKPSRRQFGITLGTLATGGAVIATQSQPARAAATVDPDGLSVPDVEATTDGKEVVAVNLAIDASYAYTASVTPDAVTLTLLSADTEDQLQPLDTHDVSVIGPSDSATVQLSGDITDNYHFAASDFDPGDGGTVSHLVWAGLRITVEHGGEVLAEKTVTDSLRVTSDGTVAEATTALGGTGEVVVETA